MSKIKYGTDWQESLPDELPRYMKRNIDPGPNGCWNWNRSKDSDGYGWASYKDKTWLAHRLAYTFIKGDIPEGMCLDHLCRNRGCVNPSHLEPVTSYKNILRSPIGTAGRDSCLKCGGPFEVVGDTCKQRRCKPCAAKWRKEYQKEYKRGLRRRTPDGKNSRSGYPSPEGE